MEERNRRYYQSQDHDMGEDTGPMTPDPNAMYEVPYSRLVEMREMAAKLKAIEEEKGVFLPGVEEGDFSWLVTLLAILTSEGELWIEPTLVRNAKQGGYLDKHDTARARRLLDALSPHAKTNAELGG
jgi:hypothetical protein